MRSKEQKLAMKYALAILGGGIVLYSIAWVVRSNPDSYAEGMGETWFNINLLYAAVMRLGAAGWVREVRKEHGFHPYISFLTLIFPVIGLTVFSYTIPKTDKKEGVSSSSRRRETARQTSALQEIMRRIKELEEKVELLEQSHQKGIITDDELQEKRTHLNSEIRQLKEEHDKVEYYKTAQLNLELELKDLDKLFKEGLLNKEEYKSKKEGMIEKEVERLKHE